MVGGEYLSTTEHDIELFIRKNYSDIYRYLYHKVSSVPDAQDLTQATFLKFVRSVRSLQVDKISRAYLFTIARTACIDFYRSTNPHVVEITATLEDTLAHQEIEDDGFSEAIAHLCEEERDILFLRYSQCFGIGEIAEIVGSSRFSVRRTLKRALSSLEDSWEGPTP